MKKSLKTAIDIIITLLFVLLIAWIRGILKADSLQSVYLILCDSFFVIGMLMLCFSILSLISKAGFFNSFRFARQKVKEENKTETYEQFQERRKHEGGKTWFIGLLWYSLAVLIVSAVFLVLYKTSL